MTCTVSLCAVCRMAGLSGCPARGTALPLVAAEVPKVERRPKIIWLPPGTSLEQAERILDKFYGPRR